MGDSYLDTIWVDAEGYGWFRETFSFGPPVERIDITWESLPAPGENSDETNALPDVEVNGGEWDYWWVTEDLESLDGDFVEDELYYLNLSVEAYNGFAEEADILFNGKVLPEEMGYWVLTDWGLELYIPFLCGREPLERLELQVAPLAGKTAEEVSVTVSQELAVVQLMWGVLGDDGMLDLLDGAFTEGETYYLVAMLTLPDAKFADYAWTDIVLNGKPLATELGTGATLVSMEDGQWHLGMVCTIEAEGTTTSTTQSTTSTTQSTTTTATGTVVVGGTNTTTTVGGDKAPSSPSTGDTTAAAVTLMLVALFAAGITLVVTNRKKA